MTIKNIPTKWCKNKMETKQQKASGRAYTHTHTHTHTLKQKRKLKL